jgi:glycosyltransferase involved in cell wall biosynthesis
MSRLKSKKIAFITTMGGVPWGGSEFLWSLAAEQALLQGYEVLISIYDWSVDHPRMVQLQQQGAKLLLRPSSAQLSLPLRVVKKLSQHPFLSKLADNQSYYQPVFDWQPDVICISQGGTFDVAFLPDLFSLLKASSIPYILVSQFNSDTYLLNDTGRSVAQNVFANAASTAFVSHNNFKLTERQLAQAVANAVVVQNPANLADLSIVPWPWQSVACFACVARLDAVTKGLDVLFESLSTPIWQMRDWQCSIYGTGPDRGYLEALANHYKISDRIRFRGHTNDVRSIWAENHLLILPSRAEGTSLALLEAMLCGRPAIVTDVGDSARWIEEPETGFVAEAPTIRSLGAALSRAWAARDDWKLIGARSHAHATAKFDRSPGQQLLTLILNAVK